MRNSNIGSLHRFSAVYELISEESHRHILTSESSPNLTHEIQNLQKGDSFTCSDISSIVLR